MAAGALLFNEQRQLLIVKPSYKKDWLIPGGVIEENESPLQGCLREIKEEVGLALTRLDFVAVDYMPSSIERTESLQFLFKCENLTVAHLQAIHIDGREIIDMAWLDPQTAVSLLSPRLQQRIKAYFDDRLFAYAEASEAV